MSISTKEVHRRFDYHEPPDEKTAARHAMIRARCYDLADLIVANTPGSREQALAITSLEETMMWTNAAIARNPTT